MGRFYIESKDKGPFKCLAIKESKLSFIGSEPSDFSILSFNSRDKAVGFFINYVDAIMPEKKVFYCKDDGFFYKVISPFNIDKTKYRITECLI